MDLFEVANNTLEEHLYRMSSVGKLNSDMASACFPQRYAMNGECIPLPPEEVDETTLLLRAEATMALCGTVSFDW